MTWDFAVFAANGPERTAYICIPRDSLPGFVDRLEHGALDDAIASYLARPARRQVLSAPRQVLSAHRQTGYLGLYDQMGAPAGLLAPERDSHTGRQESARRSAKPTFTRPGKSRRPRDPSDQAGRRDDPSGQTRPRFARRALLAAAVLAALLAGAGAVIAAFGHARAPAPTPLSFQPSALSFPAVAVHSSTTESLTMTNASRSPITVSQIRISGSGRGDFSIPAQYRRVSPRTGGQAIRPVLPLSPACPRPLMPAETCTVAVRFAPSAAGQRTADLLIYLTSRPKPWTVAVVGTGTAPSGSGGRGGTGGGTSTPSPQPVSVSGISPLSGLATGGTPVKITGSGFTAGAAVKFGSVPATSVTVVSGTEITAVSPAGTGSVDVVVTVGTVSSGHVSADLFGYQPVVSAISPASGLATGGTPVKITGSGFTAGAAVDFGSVPATSVTVVSGTEITAVSPAGTGSVDVAVTVGTLTSTRTTSDQFSYQAVSGISPASGSATGDTPVTITGSGFTAGAAVDFGSVPATSVTVVSGTEIVATSPASSTIGPVSVTVTIGGITFPDTGPGQFTYRPAITSIDPAYGPASGTGPRIEITGIGFTPATTVNFGSTSVTPVKFISSTEIVVPDPAGPAGMTVDVTVTVGTLTSQQTPADQFTFH